MQRKAYDEAELGEEEKFIYFLRIGMDLERIPNGMILPRTPEQIVSLLDIYYRRNIEPGHVISVCDSVESRIRALIWKTVNEALKKHFGITVN